MQTKKWYTVRKRALALSEVDDALVSTATYDGCALVLIGHPEETARIGQRCLAKRNDLVVLYIDIIGDGIRIELRNPTMETILNALHDLVERSSNGNDERVARIRLPLAISPEATLMNEAGEHHRPSLMQVTIDWIHAALQAAVERTTVNTGDVQGLSLTRASLLESLRESPDYFVYQGSKNETLYHELRLAETRSEHLALAYCALGLEPIEYRLMALALAPELDIRFQRCFGFLLDDLSRHSGTLGLYRNLLGASPSVSGEMSAYAALSRWSIFESVGGRPTYADEPIRLDPYLAQWLLGDRSALANDLRVRRVLRERPWLGVDILRAAVARTNIDSLYERARTLLGAKWFLLGGNDAPAWRALFELAALNHAADPLRIELARLGNVDVSEIAECAVCVSRMSLLLGGLLVVDASNLGDSAEDDERARLFFRMLGDRGRQATVICSDVARMAPLLESQAYEMSDGPAMTAMERIEAFRAAASGADVQLTEETAEQLANQYPLCADGLEVATQLAAGYIAIGEVDDSKLAHFVTACKNLASEGLSTLAERIEPVFSLEQIVLPMDRKEQLHEIVSHVQLAPKVLNDWNFGRQLPYGRGVTALFYGPSGTGKTMAAMGIAQQLRTQLLRIDLSRVVSKYIGDTEKNIDRVFADAERSGSAILVDEADALLGKRGEVKDAHDRYANIEVAYLLQRIESYEGLVILTTNMRQNLDTAFLRRLRFIVEFPRPDADARECIWRQCLPQESHQLDDAAFRLLARKIDLTGGHIRQITLRAAFIAVAGNTHIALSHIDRAAQAEYAKLGMPPADLGLAQLRRAA